MEIQQLRYALAVLETGSFAQAAKRCYTSRQNISHAIKAVEAELGVDIFVRDGNSNVPTPQGLKFLQHARGVITRFDNMQGMFREEYSPVEERFKFAVSMNLLAGISKSLNEFFMDKAAQLEVSELSGEQCYKAVCAGECDASLIMSMRNEFPNCLNKEVSVERSYLLLSEQSPLSVKREADIFDIVQTNLMLMPGLEVQYRPLLAQLDSLGYERSRINIVASASTVVKMVKRGFGAAIVSEKYAVTVPNGTVAVPISDSRLKWHFYLLYQAGSTKEAMIKQVIEELEEAF